MKNFGRRDYTTYTFWRTGLIAAFGMAALF